MQDTPIQHAKVQFKEGEPRENAITSAGGQQMTTQRGIGRLFI